MKPEDYVGPGKIMRLQLKFAKVWAGCLNSLFPAAITIYYRNTYIQKNSRSKEREFLPLHWLNYLAAFTTSTNFLKDTGSLIAISLSILRLSVMLAWANPLMNLE